MFPALSFPWKSNNHINFSNMQPITLSFIHYHLLIKLSMPWHASTLFCCHDCLKCSIFCVSNLKDHIFLHIYIDLFFFRAYPWHIPARAYRLSKSDHSQFRIARKRRQIQILRESRQVRRVACSRAVEPAK